MPYANQILIMGHLGREAEVKFTPSGHSIATFSIALNVGTKDKPRTAWIDVKAWNQCQAALDILKKGSLVAVTGRLDQETWEDKATGSKRSKTLVVADMIHQPQWEKKDEGDGVVSRPRGAQRTAAPAPTGYAFDNTITDDDVPF